MNVRLVLMLLFLCWHALPCQYFLSSSIPLARVYPNLIGKIPHLSFGAFPTPVQKLEYCSHELGLNHLYIKRDDLSGALCADGTHFYGGNKVRKLEFLLADALNLDAKTVLTFGAAGSNHVVATATYAQFLGLNCIAMLKPQPNAPGVQRNLLLMGAAGAQIYYTSADDRPRLTEHVISLHQQEFNQTPYQIPTGGSSALGVLGFVNAVFELKEQIENGELPLPNVIYVTAGSCGTIAGLLLGLRAAELPIKLVGVVIDHVESQERFAEHILKLSNEANQLLHDIDQTFSLFDDLHNNLLLAFDACGEGYGIASSDSIEAAELIAHDGITLDQTYTAKTFSTLICDAHAKRLDSSSIVLFWDSYCGDVIGSLYSGYDYHNLPPDVWRYFEYDH